MKKSPIVSIQKKTRCFILVFFVLRFSTAYVSMSIIVFFLEYSIYSR